MIRITFILTLLFSTDIAICQSENVFGMYIYKSEFPRTRKLDLRPDMSYTYYSNGPCGLIAAYRDSGKYEIDMDTITLISHQKTNDLVNIKQFLIISPDDSIGKGFKFFGDNILAEFSYSDTVLPSNMMGRISDYKSVYSGSYVKTRFYHNNGNIKKSVDEVGKYWFESIYYDSGQIKIIRRFLNDKKDGEWIFYERNGTISKVDKYKKGKLKNTTDNGK